MRAPPAVLVTPRSGNSDSHVRSTYGCTLAISQTSEALNSARLGISTSPTNSPVCCNLRRSITQTSAFPPPDLETNRGPEETEFLSNAVLEESLIGEVQLGSHVREQRKGGWGDADLRRVENAHSSLTRAGHRM